MSSMPPLARKPIHGNCLQQAHQVQQTSNRLSKTRAALLAVLLATPATILPSVIAAAAELNVVVTSKPIHSLVASIMAGTGTPKLLVDGNASPHTYAMKPSDARAVNAAQVFFRVSEGLEPFTAKVVKSLPKSVTVVSLEEAPGLTLLDRRTGGPFEAHSHGHGKKGHDHGKHSHGKKGHHHDDHDDDHDEAGGKDPHIWLDPGNARAMTDHIATVLAAANPGEAERYKQNAEALKQRIAALDAKLEQDLAPLKDRPFIIFHDATQYFERRYGLAAAGTITVSPEVQPSARRLRAIRSKISGLKAACVFAEPQFKSKLVDTVVEGTGARKGVLDPEGGLIPAGPDLYDTLMSGLASNLKDCLTQAS